MKQRLLTAAVGIPVFIGIVISPPIVLAVVTVVLFVIALDEVRRGLPKAELPLTAIQKLLIWLYPLLIFNLAILRSVSRGNMFSGTVDIGARLFLCAVFSVWSTDSFAYFGGKAFGKRKLAPTVSPNKTVEGSLIGAACGIGIGTLFGVLLLHSAMLGFIIGIVGGFAGQVGDLLESAIKRRLGIKDFGGLLPGHGGVLDRFDSLMVVCTLLVIAFQIPAICDLLPLVYR